MKAIAERKAESERKLSRAARTCVDEFIESPYIAALDLSHERKLVYIFRQGARWMDNLRNEEEQEEMQEPYP